MSRVICRCPDKKFVTKYLDKETLRWRDRATTLRKKEHIIHVYYLLLFITINLLLFITLYYHFKQVKTQRI